MGAISDMSYQTLFTAASSFLRPETVREANDWLSNATAKLPIFQHYKIDDIVHSSSDGQKLETQIHTTRSRHSPKYFGLGKGITNYTGVANHVPFNARIIGANESESHYVYDLLANNTTSSFHSLQASLHHPMAHNVQFDVNYTFSKSLDIGSDGERVASANSRGYSQIVNSFNPRLNRAVSDFDVRQNLSVDVIGNLPVGRGQRYLANAGRLVDSLLGSWTATALIQASSGLPFNAYDGKGWTTNFDLRSYMMATGPIESGGHHIDTHGNPNAFSNPTAALSNMRLPYPGEASERNNFRGDGYFSADLGVHKSFKIYEKQNLSLAAEAFNLTNSVRFDPKSVQNNANTVSSFGSYSTLLTQSRRMQFSARYSF